MNELNYFVYSRVEGRGLSWAMSEMLNISKCFRLGKFWRSHWRNSRYLVELGSIFIICEKLKKNNTSHNFTCFLPPGWTPSWVDSLLLVGVLWDSFRQNRNVKPTWQKSQDHNYHIVLMGSLPGSEQLFWYICQCSSVFLLKTWYLMIAYKVAS